MRAIAGPRETVLKTPRAITQGMTLHQEGAMRSRARRDAASASGSNKTRVSPIQMGWPIDPEARHNPWRTPTP